MNDNQPRDLRKAAILVASLDVETADTLLDQMSAEQAAMVRRAVVELHDLDPVEQRSVIDEFLRIGPLAPRHRTATNVREVPTEMRRDNTHRDAPSHTNAPHDLSRPFEFLGDAACERITPLLENEHPQTIALVASHLPDDRAAELLASLAPDVQSAVIRRLIVLEETNPEILREVEQGLHSRMSASLREEVRRAAGIATVERILRRMDPAAQRRVLAVLATDDRGLADQLSQPRVSFDQITHLSDVDLGEIASATEPSVLRLALADADAALVERVLARLPERDARLLRRSLEQLGPTRLSDVDQAKHRLVELAEALAAEGRITLGGRSRVVAAAA